LCARHEDNFYKFVHEVHIHDDGLFDNLMGWLEGILEFLRHGPRSGAKLDMNRLFEDAVMAGTINADIAKAEIDALIDWQARRRKWHQDKTRQKMARGDQKNNRASWTTTAPGGISPKDFGINDSDMDSLADAEDDISGDENEEDDNSGDPIATERKKRQRSAEALKARAGEPVKPQVVEVGKLGGTFLDALRKVLAD